MKKRLFTSTLPPNCKQTRLIDKPPRFATNEWGNITFNPGVPFSRWQFTVVFHWSLLGVPRLKAAVQWLS
jgi:hypothetical protein